MSNTETTETDGGVGCSGSANGSGGEDDMFKQVLQVVDELYDTCRIYSYQNPLDKMSKIKELYTSALQLLDSIPVENRNLPTYEYLRGKLLDSIPTYSKEAEDHLCKAVQLNPSLGDAWLSLGNCIWKRGQKLAAKSCIILALNKGPNKRILCQLSMLEGDIAQDSKVAEVLIKESIKHAREALAMDVTDGFSWYCLGNALLKYYILTGAWDLKELQQSLKAYQNAERDAKMKYSPNLSFNGASVNKYLENYERALSGFEAAASMDPGLNADEEIRKMVELLDAVGKSFIAHYYAKRLVTTVSSLETDKLSLAPELDAVKLNPPYRRATFDILQEGVNKAFAIVGRVRRLIKNENLIRYYSFSDAHYNLYILSVYGSQAVDALIKKEDQVTVLDPCYRHQEFMWKGTPYMFDSLRVDDLKQVLVNGKSLSPEQTAQPKPL